MGPIDIHVLRLMARCPEALVREIDGAGTMVTLPSILLPEGWSKQATAVHFLAPQGYPFAKPDCFWADEDLRLRTGELPQNANFSTPMVGLSKQALWFSWHTDHWNASRDDLLTWIASIKDRLSRVM